MLKATLSYSQGRSARDDFYQLLGDDRLAGAIECQSQFVNHLGYKKNRRLDNKI